MTITNKAAKQARITTYKSNLALKLASRVIDTKKPEFSDLVNDRGKPMESLNGQVILDIDRHEDGRLKGVIAVDLDDLAALLPDLKVDADDKMGWRKHLSKFESEGIDILEGVAAPTPDEFELPAMEKLSSLNIGGMSDADAKQTLLELQQTLMLEG